MKSFKTSFILDKNELQLLLSGRPEATSSAAAKYLLEKHFTNAEIPQYTIDQHLTDAEISRDAIEGLIYKDLARITDGKIIVEPVVDVLVTAALSADTIWIIKHNRDNISKLILRSKELCLFVEAYPRIRDAWKITPYQTLETLKEEADIHGAAEILEVNHTGIPHALSDEEIRWWRRGE